MMTRDHHMTGRVLLEKSKQLITQCPLAIAPSILMLPLWLHSETAPRPAEQNAYIQLDIDG